MVREVRSPITGSAADSPRRGESPSVRFDRAGGHIAPHVGKSGPTNPKLRADGDLSLQRPNTSFPSPQRADRR
jgi:hypothetical protein